jgi:hypothetical protein
MPNFPDRNIENMVGALPANAPPYRAVLIGTGGLEIADIPVLDESASEEEALVIFERAIRIIGVSQPGGAVGFFPFVTYCELDADAPPGVQGGRTLFPTVQGRWRPLDDTFLPAILGIPLRVAIAVQDEELIGDIRVVRCIADPMMIIPYISIEEE